jgi:aryl-alcohol dehydrogenase-like predicted oxidoreductase
MYQANEKRYETMKYHRCGASGLMLPELSLGLWHNFGDTGVYENMKQMCFTAFGPCKQLWPTAWKCGGKFWKNPERGIFCIQR